MGIITSGTTSLNRRITGNKKFNFTDLEIEYRGYKGVTTETDRTCHLERIFHLAINHSPYISKAPEDIKEIIRLAIKHYLEKTPLQPEISVSNSKRSCAIYNESLFKSKVQAVYLCGQMNDPKCYEILLDAFYTNNIKSRFYVTDLVYLKDIAKTICQLLHNQKTFRQDFISRWGREREPRTTITFFTKTLGIQVLTVKKALNDTLKGDQNQFNDLIHKGMTLQSA